MEIIITGASRGIGEALARDLTGKGHRVILISRNRNRLEELAGSCNSVAGSELARILPFDLADLGQLEAEFSAMLHSLSSGVDALVNNAGQIITRSFADTGWHEARALFDANFFAPALLCRICKPMMKDSPLAHMVNITSMAGFQGSSKYPGLSYYSASKAALGILTESLAAEWKGEGISVNALAIGSVQTEMLAEAFPGMKASMEPEDMARFMSWFVLEGSGFYNGQIIPVSRHNP